MAVDDLPISNGKTMDLATAIAEFGAITVVSICCSAFEPAQVQFRGPVNGSAPQKSLFVDIDGGRIVAIR